MNFKKTTLTFTLVIALIFSAVPTSLAANSFKDVPANDQYVGFIEHLKEKQVTSGIGNGLFGPDNTLTRAEFATFLTRAFQIPTDNTSVPFSDINGHWAESYIKAAYSAKIITGTSPTTFEPELPVKREEAAVMIWRYLKSQSVAAKPYQIDDHPDDWALEAVQNIVGHGLHGYDIKFIGGAQYRPKDKMLRKEMAAMLDKSMDLVATLNEAKAKGILIVSDHLGTPNEPVIPDKGTVIKYHFNGEFIRTITIEDVLNPVKDGFTHMNADGTISPANIPVISAKVENTDPENIDFVNNTIPKYTAAAQIIAQMKAEVTKDGDMNIVLPKANGYTWKHDYLKSEIITGEKLNVKYIEGNRFKIILDFSSGSSNPEQPVFIVNFKMENKTAVIRSVSNMYMN
jgi:hypothetical protein